MFYTFWVRMGQDDNFSKKNSSITDELFVDEGIIEKVQSTKQDSVFMAL